MNEHVLTRLRRLLGDQWSPHWSAEEAILKCAMNLNSLERGGRKPGRRTRILDGDA